MTATPSAPADTAKQSWATGLTVFAAVMLMIGGVLAITRGIMGIAEDEVFVSTPNYVFKFDLTSWGWIHLVLGAIAVLVSLGLFTEAAWARASGVAIGALVVIANFLSLPYYPVWSVVLIGISALIIWALCVDRPDRSVT